MTRAILQVLSLGGLIAVLFFAFSSASHQAHSVVDLRAALLVLLAPLFVVVIFAKDPVSWKTVRNRVLNLRKQPCDRLTEELIRATKEFQNGQTISGAVTIAERSSDEFLRFGGNLLAARFDRATMAELLTKKIAAEDSQWQALYNLAGFLAKMAPYFGMLATVVGMIQVLNNMTDFSRISGSMALAMQGTLFGLMSFTLIYSPIQKSIRGYRDLVFRRNEMIADWLLAIAANADTLAIEQGLRCRSSAPELESV